MKWRCCGTHHLADAPPCGVASPNPSCRIPSSVRPLAYRVQNFNNQNLSRIQENWETIKSAIERGVDLANYFGTDHDNLTAANALIPVTYYLQRRPGVTLRGSNQFKSRNAATVQRSLTG